MYVENCIMGYYSIVVRYHPESTISKQLFFSFYRIFGTARVEHSQIKINKQKTNEQTNVSVTWRIKDSCLQITQCTVRL